MITLEDMKLLETLSNQHGVSNAMLMERAGKSVYEYLNKHLELKTKTVVLFAGQGNNAGDGFVCARHLSKDCFVFIFLYGDSRKFSGETSMAFSKLGGNEHVEILTPQQFDSDTVKKIKATEHLLVLDALIGTGIRGELSLPMTQAIDLFNSFRGHKISIDVPSGINPADGSRAPFFCRPDLTLTFFERKAGMMGIKNVVVIPLLFAPEAVTQLRQEQAKRGPLQGK